MNQPTYPCRSPKYAVIRDNFLRRLGILEAALRAKAIRYRITSRYRSLDLQAALYAQGRTTPGPRITNARPGFSPHNWDLAADFALFSGGVMITSASHPHFRAFETIVKAANLMSGRNFKRLVDAGHVQHPRWKEAITWKPPKSH